MNYYILYKFLWSSKLYENLQNSVSGKIKVEIEETYKKYLSLLRNPHELFNNI